MNDKPLTITEFSTLIKSKLESDPAFYHVYLSGEVSGFKLYPSGHCYFTLKDEASVLSCVMWATYARSLRYLPQDGDQVVVQGRISVYPARGQYQFAVEHLERSGLGLELLKLQQLKEQLAKEGLFDESRKRPLPRFPKRIAVVAGKGSAGMADILHNIALRWPLVEVLPFPSLVQGKEAPGAIIAAIKAGLEAKPDVLIIGRGGGAKEDLSAFNDEALVRFAATLPVPFISSVGHEVDTTLLDYVADKRVSTPTAAAIAAVPDKEEVYAYLDEVSMRLKSRLEALLRHKKEILEQLSNRPIYASPKAIYEEKQKKVGELGDRLSIAYRNAIAQRRIRVSALKDHLQALDPTAVLQRGYSISYDQSGKPVHNAADLPIGSIFKTRLAHGIIVGEVKAKEE